MMRTRFVLFLAALPAFSGLPALAQDLEAVQAKIREAWSRHRSMTATMRMESHRVQGDSIIDGQGEGRLEILRKGDQYAYRVETVTKMSRTTADEQPTMEMRVTVIVDGESEYLIRESMGQKFYVKVPVNPNLSVVPQTVFDNLASRGQLRLLPEQMIDNQKVYVIESIHRQPSETGLVRMVAYFLQDSGALLRTEGYDANNNNTEAFLYGGFQFDGNLDPQRFVFEAPPGVNVIDRTKKPTPTTTQATQPGEAASQPSQRSPMVGRMGEPSSQPAQPEPPAGTPGKPPAKP